MARPDDIPCPTAPDRRPWPRLALDSVVTILVITFLVGSIVSFAQGHLRLDIFRNTLVFVLACTLVLQPLVSLCWERIRRLPRFLFFVCFVLVVEGGAFVGAQLAHLVLVRRFVLRSNGLYISLVAALVSVTVATGYYLLRDRLGDEIGRRQLAELAGEQARRHQLEAQLGSLQAKLNPHFLFNCLNTIAAQIRSDPDRAEANIVRLAGLYRRILGISRSTTIPLREELELIRDWFRLEQQRFGDRIKLSIDCPPELADCRGCSSSPWSRTLSSTTRNSRSSASGSWSGARDRNCW